MVAAWNGLAISGLCRRRPAARPSPLYVRAARVAGDLLWRVHVVDGRLRRVSRDGVVGAPAGVLEDHGCVAAGFLDLLQATGDPVWLERARVLLDTALERFAAPDGGFFDTADDAEALVARPRDPSDNASPSGPVGAGARAGRVRRADRVGPAPRRRRGRARDRRRASRERAPRFAGWSLAAAESMLDGPVEVAVVGAPGADRDALERRARQHPGAVVVVADGPTSEVPLLVGRDQVDGRPAAYVCRHLVCERPVTTVEELAALLRAEALSQGAPAQYVDSLTVTVVTCAKERRWPRTPTTT